MKSRIQQFSGKEISRAGETLIRDNISTTDPDAYETAMEALSFWRACHEEPLNRAVEMLSQSAQKFDSRAIVAKRLKRTPSILGKLRRYSGMKLKNMQDIGGCRAILATEKRVRKLVRELRKKHELRIKDYIKAPKDDGYRSIHLIGDFSNGSGRKLPIELQVRTHAQHAWATAVEIIDLFTGQAIKASQGSKEWKQFFVSVGEQLALIEGISRYNQLSNSELIFEIFKRFDERIDAEKHKSIISNAATLERLGEKLGILRLFNAFAASLKAADDHLGSQNTADYVLLKIDTSKKVVSSTVYTKEEFAQAAQEYLDAEKEALASKGIVVALVSVDSIGGIKEAFPNYFADSTIFIRYISASIEAYKLYGPNPLKRLFSKFFG